MRPRDRGIVIQVGSALAYRSIPLQSAYCAAKHAIVGFTESLRSELIHDRSHVELCMAHLPGVNTPQFEWMKNRLPHKSRPVGRIFQPEVAARAVTFLADHPRRELWVGWPTVEAIVGDKFIPGLLDHYLAREVYRGHQTREPEDPRRPHNLFSPADAARDHGAHGPFDALSTSSSAALWITTHRGLTALVLATIVLGALGFARRPSRG